MKGIGNEQGVGCEHGAAEVVKDEPIGTKSQSQGVIYGVEEMFKKRARGWQKKSSQQEKARSFPSLRSTWT